MKICNLEKTYQGRVVLNVEDFTFEKGKIYAVVGANGSGKSTLLKCISGVIKADSKNFINIGREERIGYMPQNSFAFKKSLMKNLFIGCGKTKENIEKATAYVKKFGLTEKIKTRADRLSGGEKQKMALIRLLMSVYDYILLDEPTSAMDAYSTAEAESATKNYCTQNNVCVILVTHSIKQAQRIADDIIFMHEGRISEHSPAEEFVAEPKTTLAKEFLEFFGA